MKAKNLICKIKCGADEGSGFLINANTVVTASHVITEFIEDNNIEIKAVFENISGDKEYSLNVDDLEFCKSSPISILKVNTTLCESIPSFIDNIEDDDKVESYGYLNHSNEYDKYNFVVNDIKQNPVSDRCNTVLNIPEERVVDFSGLSGAPILFKNHIAGLLIKQKLENGKAIKVIGISGLEFRNLISKYISNNNIIPRDNNISDKECDYGSVNSKYYTKEIDELLCEKFVLIHKERIGGKQISSWKQMESFLSDLPQKACSSIKKSQFYYTGALWALFDGKDKDANKYLKCAIAENNEIDISGFKAYVLIKENKAKDAMKLLISINDNMKLNIWLLACMKCNERLDYVESHFKEYVDFANEESFRIMSIFSLRMNDLKRAREYINLAINKNEGYVQTKITEALILYWEAMQSVYPTEKKQGFVLCKNRFNFYPTRDQANALKLSYNILKNIYEENLSNDLDLKEVLWGLATISSILPGKDYTLWIDKLSEYSELAPLIYIFMRDNYITVPNDIKDKLMSRTDIDCSSDIEILALSKFYLDNNDSKAALALADNYGKIVESTQGLVKGEFKLQTYISLKMFKEANEQLDSIEVTGEDRKRYTYIILLNTESLNKALINEVVDFAEKTNLNIDYENADLACRKGLKWKLAEKNAKNWFKATGEYYAKEAEAIALYNQGKYKQSLKIEEKLESLVNTSIRLKQIKIDCLVGLSRIEEAIKISKTFDNYITNPSIVIFQADNYLKIGEKDKAIHVLKEFVDANLYDFYVYEKLVNLVKPDNPKEAYDYAYKLYLSDKDSEIYQRFVIEVGSLTGHLYFDDRIRERFNNDIREGRYIKNITQEEIIEFIEKGNEHVEKISEKLSNIEIPIHLALDKLENYNMGLYFYNLVKGKGIYRSRYGGRTLLQDKLKNKKIVIDYISILLLYEFRLLSNICDVFDDVFISSDLMKIISEDIDDVKSTLSNGSIMFDRLFKSLEDIHYSIIEMNPEDESLENNYLILNFAEKYHGYIIEDKPISDTYNEAMLRKYQKYVISPESLYSYLEDMGFTSPEYDDNKKQNADKAKLKNGTNLFLDDKTLYKLVDYDILQDVSEHFNIFISKSTFNLIKHKHNENENLRESIIWLEKALAEIKDLYKNNQIQLLPSDLCNKNNLDKYTKMLNDELKYSIKSNCIFMCDDRFISSYNVIGKNNHIIGIYDILNLLYLKGTIGETQFYKGIDKLLDSQYSFFIPPAEYIFSRLKVCGLIDGRIKETKHIESLRRNVAASLDEKIGMQRETLDYKINPEINEFLFNYSMMILELLKMVWKSDMSIEWKTVTSDWIVTYLFEMPCDIISIEKNHNTRITKEFALLAVGKNLFFDKNYNESKQYNEWVFPYLKAVWIKSPKVKYRLANELAKFIDLFLNNMKQECEKNGYEYDENKYFTYFMGYLESYPIDFLKIIFEEPIMKKFNITCQIEKEMTDYTNDNIIVTDENISEIFNEDIFNANDESFEKIITYLISCDDSISECLLDLFKDENIIKIKKENRYSISRFLFIASLYLPEDVKPLIQEKKRLLSLLE